MENFWPACLRRFEKELSTQQFNTWIKPLIAEIEGNVVRLVAPNRFVMQWVKERFLKKIDLFATESSLDDIRIELVLSESDTKTPASNPKNDKSPQQKIAVADLIQNNGAATLTKALKVTSK
jgi:chromosomal replication initiator protein